ncbi:unnamed protein product [Rotaria magnacalcarata]|uniref:Uncharacterized protein n=1 Tax=Rotaria magnacalcarata TaxID=392030 RepID=A0A816K6B9_9BILA|nr:unnamed protein product [Rotaria magnacalcarata]CAF1621740.1 unnamed protein product [Rotaria magnacalcarata]CAF1902045.1 unnamed protein product [Rotaria magnacalcarata]CAF2124405.1 unnamed protein product [Rotaria magnacalcarata]CAF2208739.1 unnamed protein product [Rotaria magnacalcarata]
MLRKNFDWNTFTSHTIEANFQSKLWDDDSACRVTVSVEYNVKGDDYVNVIYGEAVNDTCEYMTFETSFTSENDQQSMVSYIDYVCSSNNFCEHTFVRQWVKQLLGTENNPLHTAITYILSNSSELTKCNWKHATPECASHLCFALYDELKNVPLKNDSCLANRSSGSVYIYVNTKLIDSIQSSPIELDYKCMKNRFTQELFYEFINHQHLSESTEYLTCPKQSFTSIPVSLRSANFSLTLNELGQKIKPLLDNINRCDIYMEADYRQEDGHITITYDEPKDSADRYMSFDMILASESSMPSIWSRMYYICLPPYSCDRKLVNKWIRWLIDINSQHLQLESKLSTENAVQSYECNIWSHTVDNSVDVCFAYKYKKMESGSPRTSCSRFEHKKTPVYKHVINEILQQCVPKTSLNDIPIASSSIAADLPIDRDNRSDEIKSLNLNPKVKSNPISQSTTVMSASSTTTTVAPPVDPKFS